MNNPETAFDRTIVALQLCAVVGGLALVLFTPNMLGSAAFTVGMLSISAAVVGNLCRPSARRLLASTVLALIALAMLFVLDTLTSSGHANHETLAIVAGLTLLTALLQGYHLRAHQGRAVRLHRAFASAPIGMVWMGPQGQIEDVNEITTELLGITRQQLIGEQITQFQNDEDADTARLISKKIAEANSTTTEFERRFERADGQTLWLCVFVTLEFDRHGALQHAIAQLINLTARRQAEQALKENEARFRAITEFTGEINMVIDADGLLSYTNQELGRVIDDDEPDYTGRSPLEFIHPADHERFSDALTQTRLAEGETFALPRVRMQSQRGSRVYVEIKLTGLYTNPGINGTVANCRVITDQLEAEEALRRNQAKFATVFHASPDAILITRARDDVILDFNESFTRMTGVPREQGIGVNDNTLGVWSDPKALEQIRSTLQASGECVDHDATCRARNGQLLDVEISARYIELNDELCVLTVIRDVTDRKHAEIALSESEEKFRRIFHASPDGVAISDLYSGEILDSNQAFLDICDMPREQLLDRTLDDLTVWGEDISGAETRRLLQEHGEFENVEVAFNTGTRHIPVLMSATLIEIDGDSRVVTVAKDMRELRSAEAELRRSEERFRGAFDNAPIGMLLIDPDSRILQVNKLFCDLVDHSREELLGDTLLHLLPEDDRADFQDSLDDLRHGHKEQVRSERRMLRRDHSVIWTNRHIVMQRNESGSPLYYIVQIADITEMRASQEKMERLAFYDTLTELANRRLFNDRLEQAVKRAVRSGRPAALLYLDLDNFKRVNDTLGHEAGDALLTEVSRRLLSCVRQEDTVGRPGGDEFTVLLSEVRDARAAGQVAENILKVLQEPIDIAGHELVVTTSIGVTMTPDDGMDTAQLTKNADLAMYRAKERGRNNFQFFAEDMNTRALRRLTMEQEIRRGLEANEFELYFQPKIRLATREVVGAEALLRWQHPERGIVMPGEFIPIAEETGSIMDLGRWIIQESCARCAQLASQDVAELKLAINISARQFKDPSLPDQIATALQQTGVDPGWLELEITETMLMADIDETSRIIDALRSLGVKLAIDDFGTGYSSLNYLKRLAINVLKVDRTFVKDIPESSDDKAITAAVIAMAHELNLEVVAEGVETAEQLFFLNEHDCEYGQGYLFSPAVPYDEFVTMFQQGSLSGTATEAQRLP